MSRTAATSRARFAVQAAMLLTLVALAGCNPPAESAADETGDSASPVAFPRVDFTLPDLDGQPRSLSEWDGDMVVLNFWATWCPPCKKEMPLFQQRYEAHAADGFTIVAVAVDEIDETRDFVFTFGIEFPVLIGQEDAIAVGREYGNRIGALPYSVVIDRQGMVRKTHRGEVTENDLDAWLESYL
jgi:peroxiredoxin